jgi:choline dehydrogenase-like flavoprotein
LGASHTTFRTDEQVDFLIVGAGAAGGILAKELAGAGFSVVVLEQGPYLTEKDFKHDEFANLFQSALSNNPRQQPQMFRRNESEKATPQFVMLYGRCVGGGTVHFTCNYWRFHEIDFNERSVLGAIPGTGFADWPLRYADLEPYYSKAEEELGISGQAGASPFDPPRSRPYPVPPLPVKSSGALFERAAKKLGWHPFPAPMAIISQPYRGRPGCTHCGFCELFGCEIGAKSSTLSTVIPLAEATGRCEIRASSYVRQVELDSKGLAQSVIYLDSERREHRQRAKAIVLSANGAETPRLLLLSKSNLFPDGLANSSGTVGKHLMFTGFTQVGGLFEHPLNEYKSVQVTRVLHDFYNSDPKRGFYGGGGLDARFDFYPVSFALAGLPPDAPRWGKGFKATLSEYFNRTMSVCGHSTSLPLETNTISLDPEVNDAWGLPALRVTYSFHPDDLKFLRFLKDRSLELLDTAGARKTWEYNFDDPTAGPTSHLLGTCRMGIDPKSSVVNPDHQTHDVPNLFICDGSSFVTFGRGQPTCTIQALAYRAADRIISRAKMGEIRTSA